MNTNVKALENPIPVFSITLLFFLFHTVSFNDQPNVSKNNPIDMIMIDSVLSNDINTGIKNMTMLILIMIEEIMSIMLYILFSSITFVNTLSVFSIICSVSILSPLNNSVRVIPNIEHNGTNNEGSGRFLPVSLS